MPTNRADLHGLTDLHAYPYAVHWHGQPGTALAYIDEGPPQAPSLDGEIHQGSPGVASPAGPRGLHGAPAAGRGPPPARCASIRIRAHASASEIASWCLSGMPSCRQTRGSFVG